jgi:phosphoribosylglycinamide formyltransferase-1
VTGRVAVLVSGGGTNLQAMIDARARGDLTAELAFVLSNRPGVKALERARDANIDALVLDHKTFPDRAAFDRALDVELRSRGIDVVVLAGFMRLLTPEFVSAWYGRVVNIHPSLLPEFPGAHAIRDCLAARANRTGVTIHFVDAGTDTGPIIAQGEVAVEPHDTEETLALRIHHVEHHLYPRVVELVARGQIRLENGEVLRPAELS